MAVDPCDKLALHVIVSLAAFYKLDPDFRAPLKAAGLLNTYPRYGWENRKKTRS